MIHQTYSQLDHKEKKAVDAAFNLVSSRLRRSGLPAANDDRAERLVEAIAEYLRASR